MTSVVLGLIFSALPIFGLRSPCEIIQSGLTQEENAFLVSEHNKYRNLVASGKVPNQPSGTNILEMRWNDDLVFSAQNRTDSCIFAHLDAIKYRGEITGQNLAIVLKLRHQEDRIEILKQLVKLWFDKHKDYTFGVPFQPGTEYYKQLVWGKTNEVGCGYTEFKQDSDPKWFRYYLFCNYIPAGNIRDEKPYQPGKPSCSSYGLKRSSAYESLCASEDGPEMLKD